MPESQTSHFVACVGDAFVDTVTHIPEFPKSGEGVWGTPVKLFGGGCGANVASGIAKAGLKVGFFGRVGDDENGNFLIKDFLARGVDTSGVVRDPKVPSGVVFILVEPNGERTIIPCALGAAYTRVQEADLAPLILNPPEAVYLTGVLLGEDPSHSSLIGLAKSLKGKSRTYFDPNLRHPSWNIPPRILSGMQELARLCDVVLTGESEMLSLDLEPQEGQIYVVKRGARGARLQTINGIQTEVLAHQVKVVDATGAGDTFDAAYITAALRGYSEYDSLAIANVAGGLSVTIEGARAMPDWAEVIDLWQKTERK